MKHQLKVLVIGFVFLFSFRGEPNTYYSKGNAKALGVNLSISFPSNWRFTEGDRPHILLKAFDEYGKGNSNCIVYVRDLKKKLSEKEKVALLKSLINEKELNLKNKTLKVIKSKFPIKLENQDASVVEYILSKDVLDIEKMYMHMKSYSLVIDNSKLLTIVLGTNNISFEECEIKYSQMENVFSKIITSLAIENNWK